jgi:hypothetical protein
MKRLIKFWGNYSDKCEFSNCSTKYEILPILVDDAAGNKELQELALSNGIEFTRAGSFKLTLACGELSNVPK